MPLIAVKQSINRRRSLDLHTFLLSNLCAASIHSDLDSLQSIVAAKADQSELDGIESRLTNAENEISDNASDIATNTTNISSNAGAITDNTGAITALEDLTQDMERTTIHGHPSVVFEGVNLHLRNGLGSTDGSDDVGSISTIEVNGLGNLIVGYDEERSSNTDKSGSHNLVVGPHHNYPSVGGLLAGFQNETPGPYSS